MKVTTWLAHQCHELETLDKQLLTIIFIEKYESVGCDKKISRDSELESGGGKINERYAHSTRTQDCQSDSVQLPGLQAWKTGLLLHLPINDPASHDSHAVTFFAKLCHSRPRAALLITCGMELGTVKLSSYVFSASILNGCGHDF